MPSVSTISALLDGTWRDLIARAGGNPSSAKVLISEAGMIGRPLSEAPEPTGLAHLPESRREEWGRITSPRRKWEWIASRNHELALRGALGAEVRTSVAHTHLDEGEGVRSAAIAIGYVADSSQDSLLGIGVDLENAGRKIDARLRPRLLSDQEERLGKIDFLDAWVAKEACFKAVPGNRGTTIPEYRVIQWLERAMPEGSGAARMVQGKAMAPERLGAIVCEFALLRLEGRVIGFAASHFATGLTARS